MNVYLAMQRAGRRTASNLCIAAQVPAEEGLRAAGGVCRIANILEYRVTCFADLGRVGRAGARPFRGPTPTAGGKIVPWESVAPAGVSDVSRVPAPLGALDRRGAEFGGVRAKTLD